MHGEHKATARIQGNIATLSAKSSVVCVEVERRQEERSRCTMAVYTGIHGTTAASSR